MKICQYCESECNDNISICPSCSGNEFFYKCGNCGSVIKSGGFCSICGTRAGQRAKRCPNCATEYFSNACPNCGFIYTTSYSSSYRSSYSNSSQSAQAETKAKSGAPLWLWILGWLFIFPVPLTVIIARSEKLSKAAKIAIISILWIFVLIAGLSDS